MHFVLSRYNHLQIQNIMIIFISSAKIVCKVIRQRAREPCVCPTYIAEFMFAPRDLPTLVSAPSHLVTGAHAQQAAQLCPQVPCLVSAGPLVPCSLSVHRAVCPCVSSTGIMSAVHTMVCPWIPHVFSVSVSAPSMPCVLPIPFSRRGLCPRTSRARFPLSAQSRPHPAPFMALGP